MFKKLVIICGFMFLNALGQASAAAKYERTDLHRICHYHCESSGRPMTYVQLAAKTLEHYKEYLGFSMTNIEPDQHPKAENPFFQEPEVLILRKIREDLEILERALKLFGQPVARSTRLDFNSSDYGKLYNALYNAKENILKFMSSQTKEDLDLALTELGEKTSSEGFNLLKHQIDFAWGAIKTNAYHYTGGNS